MLVPAWGVIANFFRDCYFLLDNRKTFINRVMLVKLRDIPGAKSLTTYEGAKSPGFRFRSQDLREKN